ncbi:DUF397 domain-containing protein [Actinophytocola algeriensis]|jgi:hypothetical protein|uniref:DUF397 domain-containing protein n=1 Tax=Actinophytocola algeriensis TaxID=1768010 RepID=A0A7W7Q653_9PSEU|nr:DUF397 domain-containing protein [Actinophytocola algeriensis]MBB4907765.1 hypothetical protein [Actinophytocola algeriensis]MBE1479795.1 hypothetical protein [Actinophytocola algeriensis]
MMWRKSSRSDNSGSCVEVRNTLTELRDSKSTSATLRGDVRRLAQAIKEGRL